MGSGKKKGSAHSLAPHSPRSPQRGSTCSALADLDLFVGHAYPDDTRCDARPADSPGAASLSLRRLGLARRALFPPLSLSLSLTLAGAGPVPQRESILDHSLQLPHPAAKRLVLSLDLLQLGAPQDRLLEA